VVTDRIDPFRIDASQRDLDDLARRLDARRLPDELPGAGWDYGVAEGFLARWPPHPQGLARLLLHPLGAPHRRNLRPPRAVRPRPLPRARPPEHVLAAVRGRTAPLRRLPACAARAHIVLATVVERFDLRAPEARDERQRFSGVTLRPAKGATIIVDARNGTNKKVGPTHTDMRR